LSSVFVVINIVIGFDAMSNVMAMHVFVSIEDFYLDQVYESHAVSFSCYELKEAEHSAPHRNGNLYTRHKTSGSGIHTA